MTRLTRSLNNSRPAGALTTAQVTAVQALVSGGGNAPEAPTNVIAIAAEAAAVVYFDPALKATSYTVTASPGGATGTGTRWPITVPGLTNGQAYTFTVTATNDAGSATSAASNSVTPTALPAAMAGVTGLMGWWAADALPVVADATAVSSWADSSGNGRTMAQATGSAQPTYKLAANWGGGGSGKPAVRFDGNNPGDLLSSSLTPLLTGPQVTVYVVAALTALTNGGGSRDMRVISTETTREDRGFGLVCSNNFGGAGTNVFSVRTSTGERNDSATTLTINTIYAVSMVTGKQWFLNGTRQPVQFANIAPILPRSAAFCLGGCATLSDAGNFRGDIAEVLIFRGQHSDTDRLKVQSYLGTKYGLSMATDATV